MSFSFRVGNICLKKSYDFCVYFIDMIFLEQLSSMLVTNSYIVDALFIDK